MPVVAAGGVDLNVVGLGTTGPAVVMLHGLLLGNLTTWYFTAAPTLAERHRVVLYDLRGHGRSSRPASGYDIATMSADLEALLDAQGLDAPVDLVGHSFGGLVALHTAMRLPHRVRRLVLVDTPLPPTAPAELQAFVDQSPEAMLDVLPPGLKAAVAGGRRQARRLVEHLVGLATATTLLADLSSTPTVDDAELTGMAVPTLLLYGDASACLPSGEHLAATLPSATLSLLHGGHYLHLDDPVGVTSRIVEFLA